MRNTSPEIEIIYNRIVSNSKLFLKKAISEILIDGHRSLSHEHAVLSCLYVQMATELAVKAYVIEKEDIRKILMPKFQKKTDAELEVIFQRNGLHTIKFDLLKQHIIKKYPSDFDNTDRAHFDKFQTFRNKLVHLNLYLDSQELENLKLEMIYVIAQVIVRLISQLDFAYDSPTTFYRETLEGTLYDDLLNFEPYQKELTKVAKTYTGFAYECVECYQRTFSPVNNRCYFCEADLTLATEYLDCFSCSAKKAVVYDPLNIALNGNRINGLCMSCGDRPMVYKCPECNQVKAYYDIKELAGTCYDGCLSNS